MHNSPEFEVALRLYADAVAIHRTAIEVHARCLRRRASERPSFLTVVDRPSVRPAPTETPAADLPAPETTADQLTPRQREVVRLISRGCTNAEIADALVVTRGTAANHVAAVLTRLGVANRTQVARWAIAAGLIA